MTLALGAIKEKKSLINLSVNSMPEAGHPKAGALGQPRGIGLGGKWKAVSGW